MIKITNIKTYGWEAAIRGMRNPMSSWERSDSGYSDPRRVGPNDLDLMLKLASAGSDHAKYRRMINITMDILAPLYWWKEFDTYKVGTVANSTSSMHMIHVKEFELDDFSHEYLLSFSEDGDRWDVPFVDISPYRDRSSIWSPKAWIEKVVILLNICRKKYLETNNKKYWWQIIQLLPSSYNQLRTVQLNYEVLSSIYKARKDHKLDEWREFCKMIETLPYSDIITLLE